MNLFREYIGYGHLYRNILLGNLHGDGDLVNELVLLS